MGTGQAVQPVDGGAVGHDRPGKAQLAPEHVLEQLPVGMAVDSIDLVVGGHDPFHPSFTAGLHGGQVNLPQFPRADAGGAGVDAPGGLPLGAEVLGHHRHPGPLAAGHRRLGLPGAQHRVLPVALLAAAPPGIPQHVQHGDQGVVHPQLPQLFAADAVGLLGEGRVPGGAHPQIHRQQIPVQGLMAVGTLCAQQQGNAPPGVLQHILLGQVVGPLHVHPVEPVVKLFLGPRIRPVQAVQNPQAPVLFHLFLKFCGKPDLFSLPDIGPKAVEPLVHLAHFFPQAQAGQQVFRPLSGRF